MSTCGAATKRGGPKGCGRKVSKDGLRCKDHGGQDEKKMEAKPEQKPARSSGSMLDYFAKEAKAGQPELADIANSQPDQAAPAHSAAPQQQSARANAEPAAAAPLQADNPPSLLTTEEKQARVSSLFSRPGFNFISIPVLCRLHTTWFQSAGLKKWKSMLHTMRIPCDPAYFYRPGSDTELTWTEVVIKCLNSPTWSLVSHAGSKNDSGAQIFSVQVDASSVSFKFRGTREVLVDLASIPNNVGHSTAKLDKASVLKTLQGYNKYSDLDLRFSNTERGGDWTKDGHAPSLILFVDNIKHVSNDPRSEPADIFRREVDDAETLEKDRLHPDDSDALREDDIAEKKTAPSKRKSAGGGQAQSNFDLKADAIDNLLKQFWTRPDERFYAIRHAHARADQDLHPEYLESYALFARKLKPSGVRSLHAPFAHEMLRLYKKAQAVCRVSPAIRTTPAAESSSVSYTHAQLDDVMLDEVKSDDEREQHKQLPLFVKNALVMELLNPASPPRPAAIIVSEAQLEMEEALRQHMVGVSATPAHFATAFFVSRIHFVTVFHNLYKFVQPAGRWEPKALEFVVTMPGCAAPAFVFGLADIIYNPAHADMECANPPSDGNIWYDLVIVRIPEFGPGRKIIEGLPADAFISLPTRKLDLLRDAKLRGEFQQPVYIIGYGMSHSGEQAATPLKPLSTRARVRPQRSSTSASKPTKPSSQPAHNAEMESKRNSSSDEEKPAQRTTNVHTRAELRQKITQQSGSASGLAPGSGDGGLAAAATRDQMPPAVIGAAAIESTHAATTAAIAPSAAASVDCQDLVARNGVGSDASSATPLAQLLDELLAVATQENAAVNSAGGAKQNSAQQKPAAAAASAASSAHKEPAAASAAASNAVVALPCGHSVIEGMDALEHCRTASLSLVHRADYVPLHVPAEGGCGVWSFLLGLLCCEEALASMAGLRAMLHRLQSSSALSQLPQLARIGSTNLPEPLKPPTFPLLARRDEETALAALQRLLSFLRQLRRTMTFGDYSGEWLERAAHLVDVSSDAAFLPARYLFALHRWLRAVLVYSKLATLGAAAPLQQWKLKALQSMLSITTWMWDDDLLAMGRIFFVDVLLIGSTIDASQQLQAHPDVPTLRVVIMWLRFSDSKVQGPLAWPEAAVTCCHCSGNHFVLLLPSKWTCPAEAVEPSREPHSVGGKVQATEPRIISRHNQILGFANWDVVYSCFTEGGMSGSPVLLTDGTLMAVHRREGPLIDDPIVKAAFDKSSKTAVPLLKKPKEHTAALTAFSVGVRVDLWLHDEFNKNRKYGKRQPATSREPRLRNAATLYCDAAIQEVEAACVVQPDQAAAERALPVVPAAEPPAAPGSIDPAAGVIRDVLRVLLSGEHRAAALELLEREGMTQVDSE